jgi:pilus assembly protein CpaE
MMETRNAQHPVLLVTADLRTARAVSDALASNGHFVPGEPCRDLRELEAALERKSARGVLVDLDPEPATTLAELNPIIARFSTTRFMVLSGTYNSEWVLAAMQIGARHFLLKQAIETELCEALNRLIPPQDEVATGSAVVSVLGASGGCGATTVAINLAHELHLKLGHDVLLVDLDYALGAIGTCLGLEGRYGIADVLADRSRIDTHLISSTAISNEKGVHVLLSPASTLPAQPARLQTENLRPALEACRRAFRYAVVDAAHLLPDETVQVALASTLCLLVVQLNVKDIRTANRLATELIAQGMPRTRVVAVVNRCGSRGMVTLRDAQTALGGIEARTIRNDFKGAIRAVNFGQALAEAAPRSKIRRDLQNLVDLVTQAAH